jgi:drug/metabolite transporter (DMT)-like permease
MVGMSAAPISDALKRWAGALAAPPLWFIQQQVAYWRLPDSCGSQSWVTVLLGLACAALAAAACVVSARQIRGESAARGAINGRRLFLVGLTTVMPLMFLVPMIWQSLAGLIYSGCER